MTTILRLVGSVVGSVLLVACGGGAGDDPGTVAPGFVGTSFYQLDVGDLNGDGLNDIAAIGLTQGGNQSTSDLHVILQDPASPGRFATRQRLPLTSVFGAVVIADLNGDMHEDIAVTEPGRDQVRVLLQDALTPGRFTLSGTFTVAPGVASVEAADVDLDELADLIVTTSRGVVALRQDAAAPGSFPADLAIVVDDTLVAGEALPVDHDGLAAQDLDGDALLDIATVRWDVDVARIYHNDAAVPGTFSPATAIKLGFDATDALAIADLDQDGFMDILAVGDFGGWVDAQLRLFLQDPRTPGTFTRFAAHNLDESGLPIRLAVADVTDDGRPDVLVAKRWIPTHGFVEVFEQVDAPNYVRWLGHFPVLTLAGVSPYLRGFAVADLNDDGLPDAVTADGELSLLLNDAGAPGHLLAARPVLN